MFSSAGLARRYILDAAADPIKQINAAFGARPERGLWPVCPRSGKAVLDRVEVNEIHVRRRIPVVANSMLPEAAVPVAAFTVCSAATSACPPSLDAWA